MKRIGFLVLFCLVSWMVRAVDQASFVRAVGIWPAGETTTMNAFVGFRGDFDAKRGDQAVLRIAGSSVYRIFLNGQFVGYGPARGPKGWFRVDAWDLTSFVREGSNALAIEVSGYNVNTYYIPDTPSFVCAEVERNGHLVLATGEGGAFRAVNLPRIRMCTRYTFQRGFAEAYVLKSEAWAWRTNACPGMLKLARTPEVPLLVRRAPYPLFELKNVTVAGETSTSYDPQAQVVSDRFITLMDGNCPIKGYPQETVDINAYAEIQRVKIGATTPFRGMTAFLGNGKGALLDVGLNDTGFLALTVRCTKPGRLIVTFDEILDRGVVNPIRMRASNGIIYDFVTPGVYRLENFEPNTFRYAHLFLRDGEAEVSEIRFRTYKNPEAFAARFESSDPALNRVFVAARETFAQNAVDVFTDCPSRERAGWLCDSFFTARVNLLLTGSVALETLFLENFALPKAFDIEKGMLPMCYPSDHPDGNFIPNWALWGILELDEYARRGGDPAILASLRPKIEGVVDYLWKFRNTDGLLERLPRWVFVEWSQANKWVQHVNYPSNMTWAEALDAVARLYGRSDLAAEAARVRETVRRQAWNGIWFCDHAVRRPDGTLEVRTNDVTETCQYYAFFTHTATPTSHSTLWKTLVDDFGPKRRHPGIHPSNAFIGNYLRLECLSRAGLVGKILDETRGFFLYMADRTGTLWENVSTCASCNHGFASHAAVFLVRDILGVKNIDYRAKRVTLNAPEIALAQACVTLPTPDGALMLGWTRENGSCRWQVTRPEGWIVQLEKNGRKDTLCFTSN